MSNTETKEDPRKTQFSWYAKLLFDKLYDQFNNLHYQEDDGEEAEAEQTKKGIIETIAEGGYDLVQHVLCDHEEIQWQSLEDISVAEITDMTEWPSNP